MLRVATCKSLITTTGRRLVVHRRQTCATTQRGGARVWTNTSAASAASPNSGWSLASILATTNLGSLHHHHLVAVCPKAIRAFGVGSVAGLVTSLAGLGGALVMIPVLTTAPLHLSQHAAHGTALFAVAATGVTGAWTYRHYFTEDCIHATVAIAVTGMVTARLGARLTTRLSPATLKRALGSLMLTLSVAVPLKDSFAITTTTKQEQGVVLSPETALLDKVNQIVPDEMTRLVQCVLPYAAVGSASGFLAGLFGVGGGILVVPALTIFSSCGSSSSSSSDDDDDATTTTKSHYQILATSLLATSLPGMVGTWTHLRAGNVVMRVAPALAAGACVGAVVGGQLAQETDETILRTGLTGLLAVLGTRTLLRL